MYQILRSGEVIGHSKLEAGDPPMGCAGGAFFPTENFGEFEKTVSPEPDDDPAILRWIGLSASTAGNQQIECKDVVLFAYNLEPKAARGFHVDILGVEHPNYAELFSEHVSEYERQMTEAIVGQAPSAAPPTPQAPHQKRSVFQKIFKR